MRVRETRAPRLIAGRFSRAERQRQRLRINLDDAALSLKTQVRYYQALKKVIIYFEKAKTEEQLDGLLCQWVRKMWRSGEPLLTIGDALSALHFYQPWTRRRIPHAWKLFSVWRKIEVPSRAPPLTWQINQSMAAYNGKKAIMKCLQFYWSHSTVCFGRVSFSNSPQMISSWVTKLVWYP